MNKSTTHSVNWQHPFVDVFKYFKVYEPEFSAKKGNAVEEQDNNIGRKVYKIIGSISASNYIQLPDYKQSSIKNLGLIGRYVYIELIPIPNKFFSIHLDFQIADIENPYRFTLSNLFEQLNVQSANQALQIPYPRNNPNKWTVVVLDINHLLEHSGLLDGTRVKQFEGIHKLRSLQVCASLLVRGIYTSDQLYAENDLPKEMNFKQRKDTPWKEHYQFQYYPTTLEEDHEVKAKQQSYDNKLQSKFQDREYMKMFQATLAKTQEKENIKKNKLSAIKLDEFDDNQSVEQIEQSSVYQSKVFDENQKQEQIAQKPPIMTLNHTLGFSGQYCPDIKWGSFNDEQELIYASGGILVSSRLNQKKQRFFIGHTKTITCMDISKDEKYIATAQEGPQVIIKVWDYSQAVCVYSWQTNYIEVRSVSFSFNREYLCTVGVEEKNRETILIWQLAGVSKFKQPKLVAKQTSDFNILSIKFSPIETDKLVSCGRENIRFWRIKQGHLPGCAVVLNHHARNTVFTVFDFEYSAEEPHNVTNQLKRVFVGSKLGLLFQVNYYTRELEGVFKTHENSICSISISAGFVVTGSEDQYLRVWPLDFSEFFLEAKHEGIVISLDVSNDGLMIACGASNGGLGIMDLGTQSYKTVLRSHTDTITKMCAHQFSNSLITVSNDQTIRVWDLENMEQQYEFTYPKDDVCTCISSYPNGNFFAGGFLSGVFRIFDIENTCIVEEGRYHSSEIKQVQYSPDGKYLVIVDENCHYCLYDVERNYTPFKNLDQEVPSENPFICFRQDGGLMCTVGDSGSHINVYETGGFTQLIKFFSPSSFIKKIMFSPNMQELIVITTDCKVKIYGFNHQQNVFEVFFLKEAPAIHRESINDVDCSSNQDYLVTVGSDMLIKVWNYGWNIKTPQVFVAHVNKINSMVFQDNKVITSAGYEGIYIWEFQESVQGQPKVSDFSGLKPIAKQVFNILVEYKGLPQDEEDDLNKSRDSNGQLRQDLDDDDEDDENERQEDSEDIPGKMLPMKMTMTDKLRALAPQKKQLNQSTYTQAKVLPFDFEKVIKEYRQLRNKNTKKQLQAYVPTETRKEHNLPFKHYFVDNFDKEQQLIDEKILRLKNNPDMLQLEYLSAFNNDAHENLIWNYQKGWFAYTVQNMIIIEDLEKQRKQKVITCPEIISVLLVNKDGTKLFIGSAVPSQQQKTANIYMMDTETFVILKTFSFHTRGIQQLTFGKDGKYLLSAGNFRESTIAVWDIGNGKLLSSSYTLDKINDLKVSTQTYNSDRIFEFVTVGKDQVQFWAFTKQNKLEYFDIFIGKDDDGETLEATCCDYISDSNNDYVIVGCSSGDLCIVQYQGFKLVSKERISSLEIVKVMTSQTAKTIVITCLDGSVYFTTFEVFMYKRMNFNKLVLPTPASSMCLDVGLVEGLYGGIFGGVYYVNLQERFTTQLSQTIQPDVHYRILSVNSEIFCTIHQNGEFKLWNNDSGEGLYTFKWRGVVSCFYYESTTNLLTCFFQNDNEIKQINLSKLGPVESFQFDKNVQAHRVSEDYPIHCQTVKISGETFKLLFMRLGTIFYMKFNERSKVYAFQKIVEIPNGVLTSIVVLGQDKIAVSNQKGKIETFQIEFDAALALFKFQLVDCFSILDNPHGESIDMNEEDMINSKNLYKELKHNIILQKSSDEGIYYCISDKLQYMFIRDYQRRTLIKQVSIRGFPQSLCIQDQKYYIGTEDGTVLMIEGEYFEISTFCSFMNAPLYDMSIIKKKNKIIIAHKDGLASYATKV